MAIRERCLRSDSAIPVKAMLGALALFIRRLVVDLAPTLRVAQPKIYSTVRALGHGGSLRAFH